MKLLLENWRKFITEVEEPITTLRIFDFDETIAHTRSETRVKAPDGSSASLRNQKEFEDYMQAAAKKEGISTFDPVSELQRIGYKIDLSDFSIVKDPDEITVVTNIIKQFPVNSKTYIMTARRGQSLGPIMEYLDKIGVDTSQIRPMATQGKSKGEVMATMLRQKILPNGKSNINRIEYYEDSQKNIDDVVQKICHNEKIDDIKPDNFQLIIYKVSSVAGEYVLQKIECEERN